MWAHSYSQRLLSWHRLRQNCEAADLPTALTEINHWWQQVPWTAYVLHWDDQHNWPDPWQLLEFQRLCDLARALGIVYTLCMLDRADTADPKLMSGSGYSVVLLDRGKYVLNLCNTVVNNALPTAVKWQQANITQLRKRIL